MCSSDLEAKKRLAEEITTVFHGAPAAAEARAYFERTVQRREVPEEMPEHPVAGPQPLADLLRTAGVVKSNGEARRLAEQGALVVNGARVSDFTQAVGPGDEIRVGRHRYLRLVAK